MKKILKNIVKIYKKLPPSIKKRAGELIAAILTSLAATLTTTSCMGQGPF